MYNVSKYFYPIISVQFFFSIIKNVHFVIYIKWMCITKVKVVQPKKYVFISSHKFGFILKSLK